MNLLYLLNDNYYSHNEGNGILLNSKYDIKYDSINRKLSIKRNDDYIDGFWGKNIYDAMVVVGENGSGKTKLAYCIMNTLEQLWTKHPNEDGLYFMIVFEDKTDNEPCIKIFATSNFMRIFIESDAIKYYKYPISECRELTKLKMGYFNNVLSLSDYTEEKYGIIYDASLGGSITKYFKDDFTKYNINVQKDKIINYYEDEIFKILDFLNSDLSNVQIPFVLPKYIEISIKDYTQNLKYISEEFNKMCKNNKNLSRYIFSSENSNKNVLETGCEYILDRFGDNFCSNMIINMILDICRKSCILQSSSDTLESDALILLKIIGRISNYTHYNIFDMMIYLLKDIPNNYKLKSFIKFINWLRKTPIFKINTFNEFNNKSILHLPEDRIIVEELLTHYKATNFGYPYLSFNFGLSTGEFNLLKLFSKISGLLQEGRNGERYVQNNLGYEERCENLLLYFDEVDLSMHPRWQQTCMDWLLQFITTYFKNITVQIIFATHSPIMLSDFPSNNVLYLWEKDGKNYAEKRAIRTFGNNIHTLFMDSFFLNESGTMGSFAERKINEIAGDIKSSESRENENTFKIINTVGDDIIRNKLLQMYDSKSYSKKEIDQINANDDVIDTTMKLIKEQINNLQKTLNELEKMKDDKNKFKQ